MATTREPNTNTQYNQKSHSRPTFISIVQNHVAYHVAGNHAVNKLLMAGGDALTAMVEEAYGMMVSAGVGFGMQQRHPPHAVVGKPSKEQAMEFVRANIEFELQRRKAMFAHLAMQNQTSARMNPGFVSFPANNNNNNISTKTTSQPKESSSVQQAAQQRNNEQSQEQIKRLQEADKERLRRTEKMERLVQDLQQKDTDGQQQQLNDETSSSTRHLQNEGIGKRIAKVASNPA